MTTGSERMSTGSERMSTNKHTPSGETPDSGMLNLQLRLLRAINKCKLNVRYSFSTQVGKLTLNLDVLPGVKMKDHGGRGSRKRRRARRREERDMAFSVATTSEDSEVSASEDSAISVDSAISQVDTTRIEKLKALMKVLKESGKMEMI